MIDEQHDTPRIAGVSSVSWFGEAPEEAKVGVLLLHGRAQNAEIMRELVVDRLALPGVSYLAPRARRSCSASRKGRVSEASTCGEASERSARCSR